MSVGNFAKHKQLAPELYNEHLPARCPSHALEGAGKSLSGEQLSVSHSVFWSNVDLQQSYKPDISK
jgi:hypothetical protein